MVPPVIFLYSNQQILVALFWSFIVVVVVFDMIVKQTGLFTVAITVGWLNNRL